MRIKRKEGIDPNYKTQSPKKKRMTIIPTNLISKSLKRKL